jgi:hypothetical protein
MRNSNHTASERIEPLLQDDSETQTIEQGGRQGHAQMPRVNLGEAVADQSATAPRFTLWKRSARACCKIACHAGNPLARTHRTLGLSQGLWLSAGSADTDVGTQLRLLLQLADRRGAVASASSGVSIGSGALRRFDRRRHYPEPERVFGAGAWLDASAPKSTSPSGSMALLLAANRLPVPSCVGL